MLGAQLGELFWKMVETSGSRASLEEVGCQDMPLKVIASLCPIIFLCFLSTMR
jgi:hypothetical protein